MHLLNFMSIVCVCVCAYARIRVCICVCTCVHVCACVYIHMCVYGYRMHSWQAVQFFDFHLRIQISKQVEECARIAEANNQRLQRELAEKQEHERKMMVLLLHVTSTSGVCICCMPVPFLPPTRVICK